MSATAFQRARREAAAAALRKAAAETTSTQACIKEEPLVEEQQEAQKEYKLAELKAMCDERGIEYKAKATKKELTELLGL